jgi:hypothetical protein
MESSAGAPGIGEAAMNRSEFLFWAAALAICVFAGAVIVLTTHHQHSGGYTTSTTMLA